MTEISTWTEERPHSINPSQRPIDNENIETGRNHLPQVKAPKLLIQYQMVMLENVHISNSIQIEQVIFRNMYAYINIYTTILSEKGSQKFERA